MAQKSAHVLHPKTFFATFHRLGLFGPDKLGILGVLGVLDRIGAFVRYWWPGLVVVNRKQRNQSLSENPSSPCSSLLHRLGRKTSSKTKMINSSCSLTCLQVEHTVVEVNIVEMLITIYLLAERLKISKSGRCCWIYSSTL